MSYQEIELTEEGEEIEFEVISSNSSAGNETDTRDFKQEMVNED